MTVLSFKNEGNQIVANTIHSGARCTSVGVHPKISRDWAVFMTDTLEKESGAITAFFNGPEGNVGPKLPRGEVEGSFVFFKTIGQVAAEDAIVIFFKNNSKLK